MGRQLMPDRRLLFLSSPLFLSFLFVSPCSCSRPNWREMQWIDYAAKDLMVMVPFGSCRGYMPVWIRHGLSIFMVSRHYFGLPRNKTDMSL